MPRTRHIVISDKQGALPFSKGLMASSIMATGLSPARAFHVAELIEDRLLEREASSIRRRELQALAAGVLAEAEGDEYAQAYLRWQTAQLLDRPLVVLIGGSTGVGKSTLATQLAARLGITRIIPTDAIREVMRGMLSDELIPALHSSSFDADTVVRKPLPRRSTDPLILGFREQALAIAVGVRALIRRAVIEQTSLILEGVHLTPGILDLDEFAEDAVVVHLIVTVDDEEHHRTHFALRARETAERPVERYLEHFAGIRKIQDYLRSLAREHRTPVVPSYGLDATLSHIIDLVVGEVVKAIPRDATFDSGPVPAVPEPQGSATR